MANEINVDVNPDDFNKTVGMLDEIEKILPFLISLSNEERKSMLKLGDKSQIFVQKSLELALHDDSFLPRRFDLNEFKRDVDLFLGMFKVVQVATALVRKLEDTYMQVGSEAYSGALAVYAAAKHGNKDGELETLVDELGKRFVRKQRAIKED